MLSEHLRVACNISHSILNITPSLTKKNEILDKTHFESLFLIYKLKDG